jgi:hypothetical protein
MGLKRSHGGKDEMGFLSFPRGAKECLLGRSASRKKKNAQDTPGTNESIIRQGVQFLIPPLFCRDYQLIYPIQRSQCLI